MYNVNALGRAYFRESFSLNFLLLQMKILVNQYLKSNYFSVKSKLSHLLMGQSIFTTKKQDLFLRNL